MRLHLRTPLEDNSLALEHAATCWAEARTDEESTCCSTSGACCRKSNARRRRPDRMSELGWHVIHADDLLAALRAVEAGEPADMVYAELWANADHQPSE